MVFFSVLSDYTNIKCYQCVISSASGKKLHLYKQILIFCRLDPQRKHTFKEFLTKKNVLYHTAEVEFKNKKFLKSPEN